MLREWLDVVESCNILCNFLILMFIGRQRGGCQLKRFQDVLVIYCDDKPKKIIVNLLSHWPSSEIRGQRTVMKLVPAIPKK